MAESPEELEQAALKVLIVLKNNLRGQYGVPRTASVENLNYLVKTQGMGGRIFRTQRKYLYGKSRLTGSRVCLP